MLVDPDAHKAEHAVLVAAVAAARQRLRGALESCGCLKDELVGVLVQHSSQA